MKGSHTLRWGIALAVIVIAGAGYWFWQSREATNATPAAANGSQPQAPGGARHGRFGAALAPVQAATATSESVPRYLSGLGTVTAANTVTVRSRVDGQLLAIHFQEGHIVATVNRPDSRPWMFHIAPRLNQVLISRGPHFTSEALLTRDAQVVFVAQGNGDADAYRQAGLAVMEMHFTDYPSLAHAVETTAAVFDTPQVRARAQAYNRYLQQVIAVTAQRNRGLTDGERPRVLHIQSLKPLKVDGSHTLIDTWIHLAGGRNAAAEISGNMQEISVPAKGEAVLELI